MRVFSPDFEGFGGEWRVGRVKRARMPSGVLQRVRRMRTAAVECARLCGWEDDLYHQGWIAAMKSAVEWLEIDGVEGETA